MRVFIIKSVNLLIVAGILALYCINVHKVGEEKKAIAEKTDKKEVVSDGGNNIYFADDGIYEGSGDGFGGEIKVRLTVKDNKLEKVEILSAENETKDYLESAKKILDDVIDKQSVDVDTVSGATLSSNGIINAMKDAIKNGKVKV